MNSEVVATQDSRESAEESLERLLRLLHERFERITPRAHRRAMEDRTTLALARMLYFMALDAAFQTCGIPLNPAAPAQAFDAVFLPRIEAQFDIPRSKFPPSTEGELHTVLEANFIDEWYRDQLRFLVRGLLNNDPRAQVDSCDFSLNRCLNRVAAWRGGMRFPKLADIAPGSRQIAAAEMVLGGIFGSSYQNGYHFLQMFDPSQPERVDCGLLGVGLVGELVAAGYARTCELLPLDTGQLSRALMRRWVPSDESREPLELRLHDLVATAADDRDYAKLLTATTNYDSQCFPTAQQTFEICELLNLITLRTRAALS